MRFDQVVISSSPLMLLQALSAAKSGQTVCVIDQDKNFGGVWQVQPVADGRRAETACHLIESFPGVYELLERVTGIPFEVLETQPLRLPLRGGQLTYSSRITIAAAVSKALWRVVRGGRSPEKRLARQDAQLRILDFARYLWQGMISGYKVKAPVTGFADFIETLLARCHDENVTFVTGRVTGLTPTSDGWNIQLADQPSIEAGQIHTSTSVTLEQDGAGGLRSYDNPGLPFLNLLVRVPHSDVEKSVSYAWYVGDPNVMRVSRIDQATPDPKGVIFLFQFWRDDSLSMDAMTEIARAKLEQAGITKPSNSFEVLMPIRGTFTPYIRDRQLPEGEIEPNLYVWSSAGNLASGVANWQRGRYRFKWGRFAAPVTGL